MKLKSIKSEEFKLLDYIVPPLADGKYKARVSQHVVVGEGSGQTVENFQKESEFYSVGRAFTLLPDSVFSVYPSENAEGNFANELPFMVLNLKSLPWQYDRGGTKRTQWVALIVLSEKDRAVEKDVSVEELLSGGTDRNVYFPVREQPAFYLEKPDELCHVVDIPGDVYEKIKPREAELPYLCHAKYVNLKRTEENVSGMDGYFSVVLGNRFIPSGDADAAKITIHLVSLLGYGDEDLSGYGTIRLCSLYHWNVFSKVTMDTGFGELIRNMDCSEFGRGDETNELLKRGVVVKEHRFRTGETTASLYCSPLLPAMSPLFSLESKKTADGHLIYDKEKGVFDARYACAWQLGKMLTLSDEAMALKIHHFRKNTAVEQHRRCLNTNMAAGAPDYEELCKNIKSALSGEERET